MSSKDANFVVETLNILASRDQEQKWDVLVKDTKHVLDSRFGAEWHVLIGKSVGYAMKARKKSSIVLSNSNGEMIICWKSPGFEVEDAGAVRVRAKIQVDEKDALLEESSDSSKINIIQSPSPDSESYTVDTNKVIAILSAVVDEIKEMDDQGAARHIRTQLTARVGTIWHVAVGKTREFEVLPARDCTDHIIAATKKSGIKIQVFRHKQESPTGLAALSMPSLQTVFELLPSILFIFLCVAFIVQNSSICSGSTEKLSGVTKGLCYVTNTYSLSPLAAALFVITVLKQVRKGIDRKKKNKELDKRK